MAPPLTTVNIDQNQPDRNGGLLSSLAGFLGNEPQPMGGYPLLQQQIAINAPRQRRSAPIPEMMQPQPLQDIVPFSKPIPKNWIADNPYPTGQAAIDQMMGYRSDAVPQNKPNLPPDPSQMYGGLANELARQRHNNFS